MLQKLSHQITQCLDRATAAEQRAAQTSDLALKSDLEQIAKGWRSLAVSYQVAESLERFILNMNRKRTPPPTSQH